VRGAVQIETNKLSEKIQKYEKSNLGKFGEDDIYINLKGTNTDFVFCHESDFHIESDSFGVIENKMIEYLIEKKIIHPESEKEINEIKTTA
jgi:hypothetical protein